MKKVITTCIITILCILAQGQGKIIIDQPYFGLPMYSTGTTEIDSLQQFPSKIQFIAAQILKKSMTDFTDSITFVKGQIIDLDSWLTNDSVMQTKYLYVVPKYQLYFELADTTLGIKKYCFELSFDQYGQVIYFGWPREDYNKRSTFLNPELIRAEAIKYAKTKAYKTDICIYELKYDDALDKLCWYFSFLQNSKGNEYQYSREYKTFVIGATSLTLLDELNMHSCGNY